MNGHPLGLAILPSPSQGETKRGAWVRMTSPFCVSKRGTRQAKRDAGGSYTVKTPDTQTPAIPSILEILQIRVQTTHT